MSDKANTEGLARHPASTAGNYPVVRGKCLACGHDTLFLGRGGHVTCSWLSCPEPGFMRKVDDLRDQLADAKHDLEQMRTEKEMWRETLDAQERELAEVRRERDEWIEAHGVQMKANHNVILERDRLREENERLQRDLEHERGLRSSYQDKYNTWVVPEIEAAERRAAKLREALKRVQSFMRTVPKRADTRCWCNGRAHFNRILQRREVEHDMVCDSLSAIEKTLAEAAADADAPDSGAGRDDPTGGLHRSHDYDPGTRTFRAKPTPDPAGEREDDDYDEEADTPLFCAECGASGCCLKSQPADPNTVAVPRETLERWRDVIDDDNAWALMDEIDALIGRGKGDTR